jgi:predicted GNAT family acetyltransferase
MSDPHPAPDGYRPTSTHAAWGSGHPRLLVVGEGDRFVHEIDCDVTHVGSADDSDLLLRGADPLHAKIVHGSTDEYQLEMVGRGETSHGRDAALRTGSHFTAGPWRLVYARDEYADHGRPFGGRNGGEGAHQKRQAPRPDYARDHSTGPRCEPKKTEALRSPEQSRALGRSVLTSAGADAAGDRSIEIRIVNDEQAGLYEALVGDREVGGVTYNVVGDGRVVLLAVSVLPEFRGQGIAAELIRAALDDVRAQGRTVTNYCPVVAAFVAGHTDYAEVIDPEHPGVTVRHRDAARPRQRAQD